ncbi:MAG: hypothetical protein ACLP53_05735 [Isosphaeraceae bacterium]
MSRTEALPTMPVLMPAASMPLTESGFLHPAPVLILVPHVRPSSTHSLSFAGSTAASPRLWGVRRPRRRLRRQVRVAGYTLLGLLPLLLAWSRWTDAQSVRHPGSRLLLLPSHRSGREAPDGGTDPEAWNSASAAVTTSPAPVLLSIEPVGTAVDSDTETPVVFPGYLLPDDHHEEPVHEGS